MGGYTKITFHYDLSLLKGGLHAFLNLLQNKNVLEVGQLNDQI